MNQASREAIDAISASPAIRLRYVILASKGTDSPPQPVLPPPVAIPRANQFYDATARAEEDRHPLRHLMRLRDEAAAEIERLLAFLDATDGDVDLEGSCEDEGAACEDEGAQCDDEGYEESGVADHDGYMEQHPQLFAHCDVRVLA